MGQCGVRVIGGENLMSHVVTMIRSDAAAEGGGHFACGLDTWQLLLELGNTFGWKSAGTSYVPSALAVMPDNPTRHDYLSGDRLDSKLVDATDAYSWANALSEARASAHLAALLSERLPVATPLVTTSDTLLDIDADAFLTVMDEFIGYASGGSFKFWEGEAADTDVTLAT